MDNSFTEITIPDIRTNDNSYGYDNAPIQDQQIETGNNRGISRVQYFAMDIWSSTGSGSDGTFRVLNLIWFNGDREKTYTQEIMTGLWNTTAKITKSYTIDTPLNNIISVPSWKIIEVYAQFNSANQQFQVLNTSGSKRFLFGSSNTLSSTNQNISMINSGTDNLDIQFKFGATGSERPIFWFLVKIY